MVTSINAISDSSGYNADIEKAEELLDSLKKQDAKMTTQELISLLIEYILSKMSGDTEGTKGIQDKINSLMASYSNDIKNASDITEKLKSMENNPTANGLEYLQNLIHALEQDMKSGDMSNLNNF